MNVSILIKLIEYISGNSVSVIVSLSKWIYEELRKIKYSDEKLRESLSKQDYDVAAAILDLLIDRSVLDRYFMYTFSICQVTESIFKFIVNNNIELPEYTDQIFKLACRYGYEAVVNKYIEEAKCSFQIAFCSAGAIDAAEYGQINIVKLILDKIGWLRSILCEIALKKAAANRHYEVAELLLVNSTCETYDAFIAVCVNGDIEILKLLVKYGVNIHHDKDNGLKTAASNGHIEIAKFLLKSGAEVKGHMLADAFDKNHFDVLHLLIEHKKAKLN